MKNNIFRAGILSLVSFLFLTVAASAQMKPTSPSAFENIKIDNFGQMDANFYRGAQPGPDDYQSLAKLGIKTIVDLRDDPTDYEKTAAEAAGLKYVLIPMKGWGTPKSSDMEAFLKLANDPSTGPMYVHCKAGRHRTGVAGAVYRMTKYDWDYDTAYQEMKNYNFTTDLFHGGFKSYVQHYAQARSAKKAAAPPAPANAAAADKTN